MNIRDQRKRFESPTHSYQNNLSNFSILSNSLSDEIPKFNIRTNDPFDQLSEDLFDNPDKEYHNNTQSQTSNQSKTEHENLPIYRPKYYKRSPLMIMVDDYKIDFHILAPIFYDWMASNERLGQQAQRKREYDIRNLIKFLIDNNIQHPTTDHILAFIKYNIEPLEVHENIKKVHVSHICIFFRWAKSNNRYNNIMEGLTPSKILDPVATQSIPRQINTLTNCKLTLDEQSLSKILNLWAQTLDNDKKVKYKRVMYSLMAFFNENNISNPTKKDIMEYYQNYIFIRDNIDVSDSFEIIKNFFNWTHSIGIYDNITENACPEYIPVPESEVDQIRKKLIDKIQSIPQIKTTINIYNLVKAGFPEEKAESFINNELIFFKIWIQDLEISISNTNSKNQILRFANFLYTNNILTPTQEDIDQYYNYLLKNDPSAIKSSVAAIKRFFKWTAIQNIYPNIAINVIPACHIYPGHYHSSILYDIDSRQLITNANRPLININQIQ